MTELSASIARSLTPSMQPITTISVERTQQHFGGVYVGEFPVDKHATQSGLLFYQNPIPEHVYKQVVNPDDVSNYYFVWVDYTPGEFTRAKLMIRNGLRIAERVRHGVITKDGLFLYSRHRHDFVSNGNTFVDGGDSYFRHNTGEGDRLIVFKIEAGKLVEVTEDASE